MSILWFHLYFFDVQKGINSRRRIKVCGMNRFGFKKWLWTVIFDHLNIG